MTTLDPEYPGGQEQLVKDLNAIIELPETLEAKGQMRFTINCKGHLCKVDMLKRVDMNTDAMLMRALRELPDWTPGFLNDQPVDATYAFPIIISKGRLQMPSQ